MVPTDGATSPNRCEPPVMVAAGANVAAVVAGLETRIAAEYVFADASGGGTGADADLARAGWLEGVSEDSFESETLRSDLISTLGGGSALSLPKRQMITDTESCCVRILGRPLSLSLVV